MGETPIEWTDVTWNPVRGCTRISEGCRNCYAEGVAARFAKKGLPFHGFADPKRTGSKWTGKVALVPEKLDEPRSWRKPRRIFVNSMSDLFHEDLPTEDISRVFKVMEEADHHTYQVLTKRPMRMAEYSRYGMIPPHIWAGASVENALAAATRLPALRAVNAHVRFLSCEPLLGPLFDLDLTGIHWVIVGGESGRYARPCALEWIENVVAQCKAAGIPVFVKQLGAYVVSTERPGIDGEPWGWRAGLKHPKGGDPSEFPDLFTRQFPEAA